MIDRLAASTGRRPAPIAVYRALDYLLDHGLVHRLASRNAFVACPHAQGPHEHGPHELVAFLICETCGGVDEMPSHAVAQALGRLLQSAGFEPRTQVLEISGICAHCREPGPAA